MKYVRALAFYALLFAATTPVFAQWQTPDHSIPIGRGAGFTGFKNLPAGPAGLPVVSSGLTLDPVYQQLGTAGIANQAVTYGKIQNSGGNRVPCNPVVTPMTLTECTLGAGLAFSGSSIVNTILPSFSGAAGYRMANNGTTPNSIIDITADQVSFNNGGGASYVANVTLSINTGVNGVNGLDTGSRILSTWYYTYLISNGSNVGGLVSLSSTSPTLPADYTLFFRTGAIRTDSSNNIIRVLQIGNRTTYIATGTINTFNPPFIAATTSTSYVSASVASVVPPTATGIDVGGVNTTSAVNTAIAPNNSWVQGPSNNGAPPVSGNVTGTQTIYGSILLESSNIFHATSGGTLFTYCYGWRDKVNVN